MPTANTKFIVDLRNEGYSYGEIQNMLNEAIANIKANEEAAEEQRRREITKTEVRQTLCDALAIYANEVLEIPCDAEMRDRLEDMLIDYERDIKSLLEFATKEGNTFTIKNPSRPHFIKKLIF